MRFEETVSEKLDQYLAAFSDDDGPVPVVIRCESSDALELVAKRVTEAKGRVRHLLTIIDSVAAWVPGTALRNLARMDEVCFVEMEQEFRVA